MKLAAFPAEAPPIGSPFDFRIGAAQKLEETDIRSAIESGDWGFFHSFTTGSAVDGPGVRLVAWLSGCQFKCVFCHNPDTWKSSNGTPVPLERAVEVVSQYRNSLRTMKGGLTISGGEPLLQYRFLARLFPKVKELGVHTDLETNGYFGDRLTDKDLESIDLIMLGLKAIEPSLHKRLTGMDNAPAHEFARRLAKKKHPVWIRFVIVPGWTDNMDEIGRMADFAAELGNVQRIDVLPFHQMGQFKWEKLGMEYKMRDAEPPSAETIEQALARFKAVGLNVV
ncbi:MAG TPA: pyruvate formate-lyase-activating protein [Chthoniobacterales bacterium]